jgi:hypothetical protein
MNELDLSSEQRHELRDLLDPYDTESCHVELSDHEILVDCNLDAIDVRELHGAIEAIINN